MSLIGSRVADSYTAAVECPTCHHKHSAVNLLVDRTQAITQQADGGATCFAKGTCQNKSCATALNLTLTIPAQSLLPLTASAAAGPSSASAAAGGGRGNKASKPVDESEQDLLDASSDTVELTKDVFSEYSCRCGSSNPTARLSHDLPPQSTGDNHAVPHLNIQIRSPRAPPADACFSRRTLHRSLDYGIDHPCVAISTPTG
jgi:hypothetical protein